MTAGLGENAFAGVHEYYGHVRGRRTGRHIAGVLLMPRSVGDDELAMGGGEVAVGNVDGDSLLPLGAQSIGKLGKVDGGGSIPIRCFGHRAHMIFVDVL